MVNRLSLQSRVALAFAALLVLAVAVLVALMLNSVQSSIVRAEERELASYLDTFKALVTMRADAAAALAELTANIPDVRTAFAAEDRDTLVAMLLPPFDTIKADYGLRQFQFHKPPATSFLRVHLPERFGDDLSSFRRTVVEANAKRTPVQGLEKGVAGLGIRAVVPVSSVGRHIGTVEFGMNFEQSFVDAFKARFGVDAAVIVQLADGTFKVLANTAPSTVGDDGSYRRALNGDTLVRDTTLADQPVAVTIAPVNDFSGRPAAVVEIIMDRSEFVERFGTARNDALLMGLAVLVIGLGLALLLARGITRPLMAMTAVMDRLSKGDLAVSIPGTDRRDEIGAMAQAVEVFKRNAEDKTRLDQAERDRQAEIRRAEEERRSLESAINQEIAAMIQAVAKGDLECRLDLAGKEGFYRSMAEGMNLVADTVRNAMTDLGLVLNALARGDLTRRIDRNYQGAFARLMDDVNATSLTLAEIVSDINQAAEAISDVSGRVSEESLDLAERTEHQASSLEETAATMEQLSATVRSNAENAQLANETATTARSAAEEGGVVANAAVDAMRRIEESSRKISDIIGVIDEIAFQTNLLALNAAVEAARAGDAGKGFAVVAQEVRNLAQRSAQASKEIKTLIAASEKEVTQGVELVRKAGTALDGLVQGVQEVAKLMGEMAVASAEQASAVEEINANMAQMDEVTQKNAELVEETKDAAAAMSGHADDLKTKIGFFQLA